MEKLLKLVACMFLARSYYYAIRKDFERSGSISERVRSADLCGY